MSGFVPFRWHMKPCEGVHVVRWECGSSDFCGHPTSGILGVFRTRDDAVLALECMSHVHKITCWHSGGITSPWKLYKKSLYDVLGECPVTVEDLVEWGIVPSSEVTKVCNTFWSCKLFPINF